MRRIYEARAYETQQTCYWSETLPKRDWPMADGDTSADVAIIGAGFTGLNAAIPLAQQGIDVVVIDAETPGWGASGRNGGFCCLGGAKASDAMLRRRFGASGPSDWRDTEKAAVDHVERMMASHGIEADRHSEGETLLAHTPQAFDKIKADVSRLSQSYGTVPRLHDPVELQTLGMGGPWHGGVTLPLGFALNPAKYHAGLVGVAERTGVRFRLRSPALDLRAAATGWTVTTPQGTVRARKVILATNGYSSENLPHWLRARYLPVQSSIIVTRPLTLAEQAAQGWTSAQMAYDTRHLLHYFRLLPDGRFLFGMRGGLRATAAAQKRIARKIRADFHRLFPEWQRVEITHEWSGLVCLMAGLVPFCGPVPGHTGLYAGLGFHGNGVAMGSYVGKLLAALVVGSSRRGPWPEAMRKTPSRFPLGRYRRLLLAPAYWTAAMLDL